MLYNVQYNLIKFQISSNYIKIRCSIKDNRSSGGAWTKEAGHEHFLGAPKHPN